MIFYPVKFFSLQFHVNCDVNVVLVRSLFWWPKNIRKRQIELRVVKLLFTIIIEHIYHCKS